MKKTYKTGYLYFTAFLKFFIIYNIQVTGINITTVGFLIKKKYLYFWISKRNEAYELCIRSRNVQNYNAISNDYMCSFAYSHYRLMEFY